jgi:hypothetical protein
MAGSLAVRQSKTILGRSVCATKAEQSGLLMHTAATEKRFVVRAGENGR